MLGSELKDMFETIVDDAPDSVYVYNLFNHAKDIIEAERDWEFLKKVKASLTWTSSDTYQTAKAFPTTWVALRSLYATDYDDPLIQIPFEHQQRFKDVTGYWFADYASQNFYLCGNTSETRTLYLYYTEPTTDISAAASFGWPARFQKLIVFYAAGLHMGGTDWDTINANMAPVNRAEAVTLRNAMVAWDARLKVSAMGHRTQLPTNKLSIRSNMIDIDR